MPVRPAVGSRQGNEKKGARTAYSLTIAQLGAENECARCRTLRHDLSRILRIPRRRAPMNFRGQFSHPAQLAPELLDGQSQHPYSFVAAVYHFLPFRTQK